VYDRNIKEVSDSRSINEYIDECFSDKVLVWGGITRKSLDNM